MAAMGYMPNHTGNKDSVCPGHFMACRKIKIDTEMMICYCYEVDFTINSLKGQKQV